MQIIGSDEEIISIDYLESRVNQALLFISNIMEKIEATILYNNSSGSTGTITLSNSAANYSYIEVFYKTNDNLYGSHKVNNPNGKNIIITSSMPKNDSGNCYLKSTQYSISGTKITPQKYSEVGLYKGGSLKVDGSKNRISIVKILGWI